MDKKTIIKLAVVVVFTVGAFGTAVFAVGHFIGKQQYKQFADQRDRERDAEYGRLMGLATSAITDLDQGLGDIQGDLTSIAVAVGRDAKDLRELASRLRTIASDVKAMEDCIASLRDRGRNALADISGDSDVASSDKVSDE